MRLMLVSENPRRPGSSCCSNSEMVEGHKLVSDFLTDRKATLLEKRRQLVVTSANGDILWLVGHRPDHRYRITPSTTTVLRLSIEKQQ